MTLLQCKKCSHFVELEGSAPSRLKCPSCGETLDSSRDSVEPFAETVEVEMPPLSSPRRPYGDSTVYIPPPAARRGDEFGNYKILDEISRGAMGIVYRARQINLNRVVALKLLIAGETASQDQIERFYRESQAVAKLRHTNIVPVYDMGKVGKQHYFTMEYVEGKPLEDMISRRGMPEKQALDIIEQVGRALEHAHEQGIIHRDVKPGNVLVRKDGHVQVMDFGLAKEINTGRKMTHSGVTVGTPHYMSPEQARGFSRGVDERTDIYSMGAVLYELLTGRPPFDGDSPVEVVLKVVQQEPVSIRKLKPRVSKDLETVVMKALDKDVSRRYQSIGEFLADLERYRANEPIKARASTFVYSVRKKINKHKDLSMVISAAVIILSVVFILLEHRAIMAERKLSSLRKEQQLAAKRESNLREEKEKQDARSEKWKTVFNEPFSGSNIEQWATAGGTWEPIDTFLAGSATEPASLEFAEPLCGNVRIFLYFMLGAPLRGHFGVGVSCVESRKDTGYEILFTPEKLRLVKDGRIKNEVPFKLHENRQYELLFLRENDVLILVFDGSELLRFRDLDPITGTDCSKFRFLLSESKVYIDDLKIELESTPMVGSPLIVADKLFMEGFYQPAIEVYKRVAETAPDANMAAEALYKMGLAYDKQDKTQEAVECFNQVSALYENSKHAYPARLHLSLSYLKSGDYKSLERAVGMYGVDPFLKDVLAETPVEALSSYVAQLKPPDDTGEPETDILNLENYIALNRLLPQEQRDSNRLAAAQLRLCEVFRSSHRYAQATETCKEIILSGPDKAEAVFEARYLLGRIKMDIGDYASAVDGFEKWLKLYTPESMAREAAGNVLRSEGRIVRVLVGRKGRANWENYVKKLIQAQRSLMIAYVELGRLEDSLMLAESVIVNMRMGVEGKTLETYMLSRLDRQFHHERWTNFWKSTLLSMQGSYREAITSLDQSYGISAAEGAIPRMRPGATEEERRAVLKQIERAFGTDEETSNHNTRVNIMRFVAYLKLGDRAEALKHLAASLAENPDFFGPATPGVAAIFTREVLPDEVPDNVPKNEQIYCYIAGIALFAADRRNEARTFLVRSAGTKSWWPYNLARTELALLDAGGSF